MEKVIEISGCSGFSGEHKKFANFSSSIFFGNPFLKKISFMLGNAQWAYLKKKVFGLSKSIENDAAQLKYRFLSSVYS